MITKFDAEILSVYMNEWFDDHSYKSDTSFYFSQATVIYNCSAQEKAYRAGRSNYFFMILLLGTFLLCLAAVAYGVTQ